MSDTWIRLSAWCLYLTLINITHCEKGDLTHLISIIGLVGVVLVFAETGLNYIKAVSE